MKIIKSIISIAILSLAGMALRGQNASPAIVAGIGCGDLTLGASRNSIEVALGQGECVQKMNGSYLLNYASKGPQFSFLKGADKVQAIFFYNRARRFEQFASFKGKTALGIDWNSPVDQVIKAYGKPIGDISGKNSGGTYRRLVFKGIDFLYEDGRMVRISLFNDKTSSQSNKSS